MMEETIERCEEYMEFMRSDEYHEDGIDAYKDAIFEAAIEQVFGPKIWIEINEIMD